MSENRHFRSSPRPQAVQKVTLRRPNGSTLVAFTRDVSTGGLFVETQETFEPGERIEVELTSPSTWNPLVLKADVRRVDAKGIGIYFVDVSDTDLVALIDLTNSLDFES